MRIRTVFTVALLAAAAQIVVAPALVTSALAGEKKDAKDKDGKEAGGGQYVNVSPVAVPIVLNGQLINYIFITLRLDLAPFADASKLRDREPYFRDALVRAAHRKPFVKAGDYTHVDEGALKSTMMVESARIAGPNVVTGVEILSAQAQRITGLPQGPEPSASRAPIP